MNIENLIPKDKFDFETVELLKKYSFEEIKPIIPDLLEWMQDMNWPISKPIADFLLPFKEQIAPELVTILKTNDGIWKYWILISFGKTIQNDLVLNEIKRIAKNPTKEEIENDLPEIATDILNKTI
nr:DUF5071 domain-containing protein [uncultured Flavobacterium sp.]